MNMKFNWSKFLVELLKLIAATLAGYGGGMAA